MLYFWSTVLILLNALWLALIFFGLPGNWLIVISTALFAWWQSDHAVFSPYTLVLITALAALGELVEFFAGMAGAKKFGAGWRGSLGAIAGALTGALIGTVIIPLPFFGTILGAGIGAAVGAWALEYAGGRHMKDSIHLGFGAGLGALAGIATKIALGITIWLIVAAGAFWP